MAPLPAAFVVNATRSNHRGSIKAYIREPIRAYVSDQDCVVFIAGHSLGNFAAGRKKCLIRVVGEARIEPLEVLSIGDTIANPEGFDPAQAHTGDGFMI